MGKSDEGEWAETSNKFSDHLESRDATEKVREEFGKGKGNSGGVANGHESLKQGTCGVESASGSGQGRIERPMQVDPPTDPPATLDPPEPVALPQTREESQDEKGKEKGKGEGKGEEEGKVQRNVLILEKENERGQEEREIVDLRGTRMIISRRDAIYWQGRPAEEDAVLGHPPNDPPASSRNAPRGRSPSQMWLPKLRLRQSARG